MSRCVIVCAGPFRDPMALADRLMPEDHVIAADGGWQLAALMGITPAVLVADFDSMPVSAVPESVKVISLPVEKDVTDTAKALEIGFEAGYREFLLLGCTGGRLDHLQAVLTVAADYTRRGCAVVIADEQNEIYPLAPGNYVFPVCPEEKVSLFAFGGDVTGLYADGLKYPIADYTLSPFDPLCVSNECLEEDACICFKDGLLLLYFSKD